LFLELLEPRCVPSTVTNLSDHDPGSLRDAIATTPDGGTVDFQPGLMGTIILTSGELAINQDLTIEGPGAGIITVSVNQASRVFSIANFTAAISGLTFSGNSAGFPGGGISNDGTLTVTDSAFTGNSAGFGGGIDNTGTLTVSDSSFSGNHSTGGGGIFNESNGTLTIAASTFSGNIAVDVGGDGEGGGIENYGTLTVTDSSFRGNSANVFGSVGPAAWQSCQRRRWADR
jgi:hypothetical protein